MQNPEPEPANRNAIASWTALVFALICLAYVGIHIALEREPFRKVFRDFKLPLPWLTQTLLSVPGWIYPAVAGMVGLGAIGLQWKYRRHGGVVYVHLLIMVACLFALAGFREAMFHPLMQSNK